MRGIMTFRLYREHRFHTGMYFQTSYLQIYPTNKNTDGQILKISKLLPKI